MHLNLQNLPPKKNELCAEERVREVKTLKKRPENQMAEPRVKQIRSGGEPKKQTKEVHVIAKLLCSLGLR